MKKLKLKIKKTKRKRIKYEMEIDTNDAGLKLIEVGKKEEIYEIIVNTINSPEASSPEDFTDVEHFIQFEKDHLKYIPESILNKENLVKVVELLLKYHPDHIPEEIIVPLFKNVNDVLRLALVLSGHSAADLGKPQKFKSFKNWERRLFMKLLNNCGGDRYDDLIKYHNIWTRFFERIHPLKYKKIYPDLIEDLLGTYRFFGDPKNRQLRMEYTFYQILLKLNERIVKYKEDTLKLIQHKKIVNHQNQYFRLYPLNLAIDINNIKQFYDLKFLENDEDDKTPQVNYEIINEEDIPTIRTMVRNKRIDAVLTSRSYPVTKDEHKKILEKFKNLKYVPNDLHDYIYQYLQKLVFIVHSGLDEMNRIYGNSWDNEHKYDFEEEYFNDIIKGMQNSSQTLYNDLIPSLDVESIQKRMNEIQPLLKQLSDKVHEYKRQRQPFNSKWIELISEKKTEEAAQLLSKKPGIFLRQLDELMSKSEEVQYDSILKLLEEVSHKASLKVLLSIKGYFQKRSETLKGRAFLIQGSIENKHKNKNKNTNRLVSTNKGVITKTRTTIYYTTKVK